MASSVGMYKLPPVGKVENVPLPTCMYQLKGLRIDSSNEESSSSSSGLTLSGLEKRQLDVLADLHALQQQVQNFAARLCVALPPTPGSPAQQLVIHASPSNPPLAVIAVVGLLAEQLPCTTSAHVHSTVTGQVPETLLHVLDSCNSASICNKLGEIKVVLIWRKVPDDEPLLVVRPGGSAGSQTPLRGQQNIGRYLCRVFLPHLYEGHGAVFASLVDNAIDRNAMVLASASGSSSKEKAAALRNMNSQLGLSEYLVGSSPTLADILVFCELCSLPSAPTVGDNVKKWQKRLSSIPALTSLHQLC